MGPKRSPQTYILRPVAHHRHPSRHSQLLPGQYFMVIHVCSVSCIVDSGWWTTPLGYLKHCERMHENTEVIWPEIHQNLPATAAASSSSSSSSSMFSRGAWVHFYFTSLTVRVFDRVLQLHDNYRHNNICWQRYM